MANNQPIDGDEIDLFDVIETLWDGRVILAGFIVSALAIGALFFALNKPEYVTKARYEIILAPPFLGQQQIDADISRTFFNPNTFARWKDGRPGTSLNIDLIDQKEMIDGADFKVPERARLVFFADAHIKIKSNDTQLIFEVLDYFKFVGMTLSKIYVADAKNEKIRFDKLGNRFKTIVDSASIAPMFESVANLDRYLDKAIVAEQMLLISRPLPPEKTSVSTRIVLAIAAIVGGVSGLTFLLFRKAYRARKLRLAGLEA